MKKIFTLIFFMSLFVFRSSAWGPDVVVYPDRPEAAQGMTINSSGTLYISVPVDSGTGTHAIVVYSSVDNGDTWTQITYPSSAVTAPILKSKLLTTGSDSTYCFFQAGGEIHILSIETGAMGLFQTIVVDDWDAAASPNNNAVYLFVDEYGTNSIRRYGTLDGGITWGGNTANVTGAGAKPKTYMSGTRLIMNYYGPVLADTATSIIRTVFYNESTPGNISPGTFQDLALNTSVKKKEFKSVIYGGIVWFFFTEGDNQQVLKCHISSDDGSTYGPEFTVAGDAVSGAYHFDARHYVDAIDGGCYLTWYADSITVPASPFPLVIAGATTLNPGSFSAPVSYSDYAVTTTPPLYRPVLVPFSNGSGLDVGVAWVEDGGFTPFVVFDRLSAVLPVNEIQSDAHGRLYPNPVAGKGTLELNSPGGACTLEVVDVSGRICSTSQLFTTAGRETIPVDFTQLNAGIYTIRLTLKGHTEYYRIVKSE